MDNKVKDLVLAFQNGSRDAFASLVSKYQNLVTSVAFSRTGDLQRSEDIAQQAFLVAWQKQDELQNPDKFSSWLRSITNNLALNEVRLKSNRKRNTTLAIDAANEPQTSDFADAETIRSEQSELLWSTLSQIPEGYREPLILFYREGQSVSSVALQMGLSEDAVKQRLSRGRQMMKREIETMVEQTLFETRPQEAFCASVMSALPLAVGTKVAGIAAAKAGAAAGSKSLFAKAAAGTATGVSAPILGALIGMLGGIAGSWIGIRQSMKHATSREEKDMHYWLFGASVLLSIVYTVGIFVLAMFFNQSTAYVPILITLNIAFIGTLIGTMVAFVYKQRKLHAIYGKPQFAVDPTKFDHSPNALRLNVIGSTFGAWAWIIILMAVSKVWVLFGASIAAFTVFTCYGWIKAPHLKSRLEQAYAAAAVCLWSTIAESLIIASGYAFGFYEHIGGYQNIPFWAFALGLPVFGFALSWWIRFMGRKQQQSIDKMVQHRGDR